MWPLNRQSHPVSFDQKAWTRACRGQGVLCTLSRDESHHLWALAHDFLRTHAIQPVGELILGEQDHLLVALLICLPVLGLDLDWYHGLHEVIIYPEAFAPERTWTDEFGIAHTSREPLSGEAWGQGLMLLSWQDIQRAGSLDGRHVVIHECAHWLDLQNGIANGCPPLHRDMSTHEWSQHFSAAYAEFTAAPLRRCRSLSPYAATSPAEFFAVCCELFFERPDALHACWPDLHQLLSSFFRQTPDRRLQTLTEKP